MLQLPPKSSCQLPASLSKSHAPNLDHDGDGDEWENDDETSGISLTTTTAYVQTEPNKNKNICENYKAFVGVQAHAHTQYPRQNLQWTRTGIKFSLLALVFNNEKRKN